ncbi:MAG: hypothetical protein H6Q59_425, partial [Firmicutes bacterium]|nr:hypothetical protein [Bacillota bacterium]
MKNQGKKILATILILTMISGSLTFVSKTAWAASALSASAGIESITVSGFTSGATLKLYTWVGGSLQNTAANVTDTTYTFTNVEPNSGGYYVTQTVEGIESENSNWINSNLGTPTATAGEDYVDVSGVYTGATVELYTEAGSL